jgi:hypothetical protein
MANRPTRKKPAAPTRRRAVATRRTDAQPLLLRHVAAIRRAAAVLARHGIEEARAIEKLAAKLLR